MSLRKQDGGLLIVDSRYKLVSRKETPKKAKAPNIVLAPNDDIPKKQENYPPSLR